MHEENKKELNVTNDLVFQRIFGKIGNEEITKGFLETILEIKIANLSLDRNKRMQLDPENKIGRLDVKAELSDGTIVHIEMQSTDYDYMPDRILFYNSVAFIERLAKGEGYDSLNKVITILITNCNFEPSKNIKKFHTKWNLREKDNPTEILTPLTEFHVIELSKFDKNKEKGKEADWIKFIKGKAVEDMNEIKSHDKALKKAKEEFEYLISDPVFREKYKERIDFLRDQISFYSYYERKGLKDGMEKGMKKGMEKGMKKGLEEGIEKGLEEGMEKGIREGEKREKSEIAKKMMKMKIDISLIMEATGLTKEQIEKL